MSKPPDHTNQQLKPLLVKIRAQKRGRWAEHLTALYLRLTGHSILVRNFKTKVGEIDLIARRHNTLCFVEVKARADKTAAAEAVTPRQRRRIRRTADFFLAQHPDLYTCDVRFDVALVNGPLRLSLIRGAWRADD